MERNQNQFEEYLEQLVISLKKELQSIAPIYLMNIFNQQVIDSVNFDKSSSKLPDGFVNKFHYVSGLIVSQPFQAAVLPDLNKADIAIDRVYRLVDSIFDTYANLWMTRPSLTGSVEEEHVREYSAGLVSFLRSLYQPKFGTSEQFSNYIIEQFEPFDSSYFLPELGFTIRQCIDITRAIVDRIGSQYFAVIGDFADAIKPQYEIWKQLRDGKITLEESARLARENPILQTRLDENTNKYMRAFTISRDDLKSSFPETVLDAYFIAFSFLPGNINKDFKLPTDFNELDIRPFMQMEPGKYYIVESVMLFPIISTALHQSITNSNKSQKYFKHRDQVSQRKTVELLRKVFPANAIVEEAHYGGSNRMQFETDIIVRHERTLIVCEVKSKALREPLYTQGNIQKIKKDFQVSIQEAYKQALRTRDYILSSEEAPFLDSRRRLLATIKKADVDEIYLVTVTAESFGWLATDLSILLEKEENDPYPLAISLFDLEFLVTRINTPEKVIDYLRQRVPLHGKVLSQDELDYAGYYENYGNLDFSEQLKKANIVNLDGSFARIFDEDWYESHGLEIQREDRSSGPFFTLLENRGGEIAATPYSSASTARTERIERRQETEHTRQMKGRYRNKPCPCGSGKKFKVCCGR